MSSISDTDLGDVSPPRPAPAPPADHTVQAAADDDDSQSGSDEDLAHLMKMKAELMAQLEGDFKLSPEESDDEDDNVGGEPVSSDDNVGVAPVSTTSESPSPPPGLGNKGQVTPPAPADDDRSPSPPGERMAKLSVSEGCKPHSEPGVKSPGSEGGSGGGAGGSGQQGPGVSGGSGSASSSDQPKQSGSSSSSGGDHKQHKSHKHRDHHHSSSSKSHHSSKHSSSSSRRHSTSSMSKDEKKKYDKLKEQQKAKIEKYEERVKSKDKLKSDKFQALDIFSNTKKPSTPYQPLPHKSGTGSNSGASTPTGVKPLKKDFEKKLDEEIKKELERREEEKKKKEKYSFKTPMKHDERRSSSDKERSSEKIKERRSSKDHESSSSRDKHRHESDKHRRSSSDKERRRSSSSSSSSSSHSSSEKKDYKNKESKYSKEKEQQELESKRLLQEAREKREREEREKKRQTEKERDRKLKQETEKKKIATAKPTDDVNDLLKQRINSLGTDNIQKLLMESLVENSGAKISAEEKQKMISKMQDLIKSETSSNKTKEVAKKEKPGPASVKKKSPVKNRTVSSSSASSGSSDSESDDDIKEMKEKVKARRVSTETATKSSRPVRNRKVRTFEDESEQSDTDNDFIQIKNSVSKESSDKDKSEPSVKKPVVELKSVIISPPRVKREVDPDMPSFNSFTQEDVSKATALKEKYDNLLEGLDEETIAVADVTEIEINAALPSTRIVTIDADEKADKIIEALARFGGNPRLFTPVPDWLIPYLQGAKVNLQDVEMPSKQEVSEYLGKKQSGKRKRKAGWDIVVDWVPDAQPEAKRSKLEKQLGFDFDSSFGCSINSTEGRRARRSNMRYSDVSTASEDDTQPEQRVKNRSSIAPAISTPETSAEVVNPTPETSVEVVNLNADTSVEIVQQSAESSVEVMDVDEDNNTLQIVGVETVEDSESSVTDDASPGKKRRSRDIIAAYLNTAGVERTDLVEEKQDEEVPVIDKEEVVNDEQESLDAGAVLAQLNAEIDEADQELDTVLQSLKNKRKRSQSTDTKVEK